MNKSNRGAMGRTLLPLVVTLFLTGCGSLIPAYDRPEAPIASQWPEASVNPSTAAAPAAADLAWQTFFADATLKELIQTALTQNRDLRVAVLNIEQARAQLGIRRADQFPTVNATATGSRAPNSSGGINSNYTVGLTVTAYELDFFDRIGSLKEQALAQYLATQEGSKTAQISLVSTVAQTWLSLLTDEALLKLSRQTLATRNASLKLVQLRFQHGVVSELDLRLAESLQASAQVTLAQQERQRALDENALVLLLGQSLPTSAGAHLSGTNPTPLQFAVLPAGLPSDLLARRPDIRQAEQQLLASNANIGAARAALYPRISLTAGAGSASTELSGLFKDGSWGFTLAPQLVLPIFDSGRNQANLDAAKAGRDIAVAQYQKAIQNAFREVADALAANATLARQLRAQEVQLATETARNRLTDLRYQNGASSQLDWLDAQRSLFSAQQALAQTQLIYAQSQVALYKALGGGAPATP